MSPKQKGVLFFLSVGITACGLIPLWFSAKHSGKDKSLFSRDKPLSGNQNMRGTYLNTGSRDIGIDPDWNRNTGTYKDETSPPPQTILKGF
jgi:hypothetical protein